MIRLLIALALVLSVGPVAFAGDKIAVSLVKNPACGAFAGVCFSALGTSSLQIKSTNKPGAGGFTVKVKLHGAEIGGVPVDGSGLNLVFNLDVNGLGSAFYASPAIVMAGGNGTLSFTGQDLTPALPAVAGDTIRFGIIDAGAWVSDGLEHMAVPAFRLGTF